MDAAFFAACDRSIEWYSKASSTQFFPLQTITHDRAHASARALRSLLHRSQGRVDRILPVLRAQFDLYQSIGWDGEGTVLYTGYYSLVVRAATERTGRFQYPLYRRPANLVSDPTTGRILGWRQRDGRLIRPPTRSQIERTDLLAGTELVWLESRLDAYMTHVNGSAKLLLPDGKTMFVGFAGTNGLPYTSIGRQLVDDGKIDPNALSMPSISAFFERQPSQLDPYIRRNDRFVFFQVYDELDWPAGSLGLAVTPMRTLATDKRIFPRGCVVMVVTTSPNSSGGSTPLRQLMLDQDTGGAIRAAGRADIYMGIGPHAASAAGRQLAEGKLYYLVLRPEKVAQWLHRDGEPAIDQKVVSH